MAIELATAYVSLVLTNKDMPKQINSMIGGAASKAGVDKAGESMGSRLASGLGKTFAVGAAAATAAAVGGVGVALTKGFQRLTAIDDATAKLDGLGHTSLGVSKIMDSALASVKGTAFGLGEAAKVSASAVAAGIKPGQDLTRYLTITADAATIAGVSMEEMGSVMNKVQAKGKAYTMDLNQMAIRGIPIYQMLAKEMNVTQEELMDMVTEGKVSADIYQKAIEKGMGGAARAGNSVSAAYANTMAAMGRLGAAALKPEFARSADWLKAITEGIDVATPKVGKFADQMDHKLFNQILPKVKEFSTEAKASFAEFMGDNGGAIGNNWERFTDTLTSLGGTAKDLVPSVMSIVGSLLKAQAALGVSTWSVFLSTLEASAVVLDATLVPAMNGLSSLMANNTGLVTGLLAAFMLFKTVPAIMGRIAPSMASMTAQAAAGTGNMSAYQRSLMGIHSAGTRARDGLRGFGAEVRNTQAWAAAAGRPIGTLRASYLNLSTAAMGSGTAIGKAGAAYSNAAPRLQAYIAKQQAANVAAKAAVLQNGSLEKVVGAMGRQMTTAATGGIAQAGRAAAGVGAAGLSAMSTAAGKLTSGVGSLTAALGGPLSVGIMAAFIAVPQLISAAKNWDRQADITAQTTEKVSEAQRKMGRAFTESKGMVDQNVLAAATEDADAYIKKLQLISDDAPGFWDRPIEGFKNMKSLFTDGFDSEGGTGTRESDARKNASEQAKAALDTLKELGVGADEFGRALVGTGGQWREFYGAALDSGKVSADTAWEWTSARLEIENLRDTAKTVPQSVYGIADAFKTLASDASTASEKAGAFHQMMNLIAGIPPDLGDATQAFNQVLRETKKMFEEPLNPASGALGGDLVDKVTGGVNTMSENGMQIRDAIQQIRKSGETLIASGGDVETTLASMSESFKQVQEAAQLTDDNDTWLAMLRGEGFSEDWFRAGAAVQGMNELDAALAQVKFTKDSLKPGEKLVFPIELMNDEAVTAALDKMGYDIKELNGGTHIELVARDAGASDKLDEVAQKAIALQKLKVELGMDINSEQFDYKAGNAQDMIKFISGLELKPGATIRMEEFDGKKQLTLQEIQALSEKVADPSVLLKGVKELIDDAGKVRDNLDEAAKPRTANITIAWSGDLYAARRAANPDFIGPISGSFRGSRLPRNAMGSRLPTTGPGTDTVDGILGVGSNGVPTTWVDKGEWIINGRSSEKHDRLLGAINRDEPWLKDLPAHAEGGRNGITDALSAGKSVQGNKYVWGGTGPTGFDCSGFVGWLQQIAMGIVGSTKRLYTTYDLIGGRGVAGLEPGLGPSGTQFRVGVSQEHMAATIAGQNAESGGSMGSSGIGPQWAGAEHSQFPVKMHLPNSKVAGWIDGQSTAGAGNGVSSYNAKKVAEWTEANQLALEKAELAIVKARETRDAVYANSKKSQNDRDIADKNVEIAERRVVDLNAKKDRAAAGLEEGPPPQAPALERAFAKGEKERLQAQMAVDEADGRRNEVYADDEATDNDRLKADIALDDARQALEEVLKGSKDSTDGDYSLNGIGKTFAHRAVDALFAGIEGQDYFGLMDSRWLSTDWTKVVPANWNQDDVEAQLPVTPGQPGWLETLFNTGDFTGVDTSGGIEEDNPLVQAILRARGIRAPGKPRVFDNGGWLMPGEMAINQSARPEPIFNSPEQLRQFGVDHIKPPEASGGGGNIDARIIFEGDVYARDDDALIERIRKESDENIRMLKKR